MPGENIGDETEDTVEVDPDDAPQTIYDATTLGDPVEYDYSAFLGTWLDENDNVLVVERYDDGREHFQLSDANDDWTASGIFQYVEEYGCVYAHNDFDGIAYLCLFDGTIR